MCCYTDWVQTLVTTISCRLGQSNGSLMCPFAGGVIVGVHNEGGRYIYSPSLNDKDDKNDKESEKSPMRVIIRGLWKPCHCCHSCHGARNMIGGCGRAQSRFRGVNSATVNIALRITLPSHTFP